MTTQATTPAFTGSAAHGAEALARGQQQLIIDELVRVHGLDPSQISFDGNDLTPIFDYEAVSTLTLKLTDIQDIECWIVDRSFNAGKASTAKCRITLPDGRTRTVEETVEVGEVVNGRTLETSRDTDGMAQNRAVRRGIRSVGINLWRAHQAFMRNGQIANGSTDADPRNTLYSEIHALAEKIGLIVGQERSNYEAFIAEQFSGITSAKDLDDSQLVWLRNTLRAMSSALSRATQPAV